MTARSLRDVAEEAREHAYAPYSGFRVGAALRADDGRVFAGANVENAAYGLGNCAERAAVAAAITAGARTFDALALVSDGDAPAPPCGACRQVLAEFAPQLLVTSYGQNGEVAEWTVDELLPHRFRLHDSDGSTT